MRKHYMTICFRGADIEVTHIQREWGIEVTFEQATKGGFNTLVTDIDGNIKSNVGFNGSDVDFLLRFLQMNKPGVIAESKGVI